MKRTAGSPITMLMVLATATLAFCSPNAKGQDDITLDDGDIELEEIIVTGSRIPRDEFSSPSPIQFLDVEEGRKIGVTSIADLLRRSPVVNGTQIDTSLNTSTPNNATEEPPPGGVGSSNISLRGLEPERTLVLLNGRRLGSTGVRGAPSQPDISLIPFALVERAEVLTEGASAVYGADAVAGVVNVILRDEFEGLEIMAGGGIPSETGGETQQLSILMGVRGERGSIQLAAELFDRTRVTAGDRDFAGCLREIEQLENGSIESVCRSGFPDNVTFPASGGRVFFTLGQTDIGIPNWSSADVLPPPDHPLVQDPALPRRRATFIDFYSDQDDRRAADLLGGIERFSVVTSGKLYLDSLTNGEFYFESMYLNSQALSKAGAEQIFPTVLAQIPQEDANGNTIVDANGAPVLADNPLSPFPVDVAVVVTLDSLPQHRDVERQQSRLVLGVRGDVGNSTWSWDTFASYDRGIGFQAQPILFEPNLELSLFTLRLDANGNPICGPRNPADTGFGFITPQECVPLDITNTDLYVGGPTREGVFTTAEEAYLIGNRTNRTVVEQTMISAFATGELFTIGEDRDVSAAFGAEYRLDEIASQNDTVGVLGLNAAENPLQEGSTIGERYVFEAFAEINFPLLDSLDFDAAIRYTDEENFGSKITWRGRVAWSPVDYLTVSGSAGTSYRAPNLREQFLAGQGGGVGGFLDPCEFFGMRDLIDDVGDMDPRAINLTNNCALAGVQMLDLDGNGFLDAANLFAGATIPTATSGNTQLVPETSDSYTATLQFAQPWFERFDLDLAISYWDIVINNTVEEQEAGDLLDGCYTDLDLPDLSSPLCSRHTRGTRVDGFSSQVNFIDISFINIGEQTARGIDLNTQFLYSFSGAGLDLMWRTASTLMLEQEQQIFSAEDRDDNLNEIGTPKLRFNSTLSLLWSNWEFMMQNRYVDDGESDFRQDFQDFMPGVFAPVLSRPILWVDSTWYTDISMTYGRDTYSITAGISNLFDESPPLISFGGPNRNNAVTSSGYDLIGRTFFITARIGF